MKNASGNGIKKLVYRISGEKDILNSFSPEGFELLSASFLSFIDLMCPTDSEKDPILLEITGVKLSKKQQQKIDNALWLHYRLRMTWIARDLRACRMKTLWFLLCTVLSSVLLYMAKNQTFEVMVQFLYLPIWFFGYRLLTFPLQTSLPLQKNLRRCRYLASMKLIFSEEPMTEIPDSVVEDARKENAVYYDQAIDGIRKAELTKKFIKEDGTVILTCRAENAGNLINPCSVPGQELISDELAVYLDQAGPFINPKKPLELLIQVKEIFEEEKKIILNAFKNYGEQRFRQARGGVNDRFREIISYAIGLFCACILLYLFGKDVGLGLHEFLVIALWFFADYLVEFVLLDLNDAKYEERLCRSMMSSHIRFVSEEEIEI